MNPTTVQNVVTYDTIVDFDNPDLKIFPGMTAYVTIPVASVENALRVPNTALRFEPPLPPEEIRRLASAWMRRTRQMPRSVRPQARLGSTALWSGNWALATVSNPCR